MENKVYEVIVQDVWCKSLPMVELYQLVYDAPYVYKSETSYRGFAFLGSCFSEMSGATVEVSLVF